MTAPHPWASDPAVIDLLGRPFRPAEHPDPTMRKKVATQRAELLTTLAMERDRLVGTRTHELATERLAAAAAAGLNVHGMSGVPLAASLGSGGGGVAAGGTAHHGRVGTSASGANVGLSQDGRAALALAPPARRGFAMLLDDDIQHASTARTARSSSLTALKDQQQSVGLSASVVALPAAAAEIPPGSTSHQQQHSLALDSPLDAPKQWTRTPSVMLDATASTPTSAPQQHLQVQATSPEKRRSSRRDGGAATSTPAAISEAPISPRAASVREPTSTRGNAQQRQSPTRDPSAFGVRLASETSFAQQHPQQQQLQRPGSGATPSARQQQQPTSPRSNANLVSSPSAATMPSTAAGGGAAGTAGLPQELLQLVRSFRSSVDVITTTVVDPEAASVKALSMNAAALTRYVTAYVVSQEAERRAESEATLRGWMRRPRLPSSTVDPISAVLGIADDASAEDAGSDDRAATSGGGLGRRRSTVMSQKSGGEKSSSLRPAPPQQPAAGRRGAGKRSGAGPGSSGDSGKRDGVTRSSTTQAEASSSSVTMTVVPQLRFLCSATMISVHVVLDALLHLCQCDRASLFLYDETSCELVSVAIVGASSVVRPLRIPADVGAAGAAYHTGVIINIPNTDTAPPTLFAREVGHRTGYYTRSLLTAPVRCRRRSAGSSTALSDELVGVVQVVNKQRPANNNGFTTEDEGVIVKIAALLGSMLAAAGPDVTFTGTLASEEGVRAQMLVHSFHEMANTNRGRTTSGTAAGSVDLTLTEARTMQRQQRENDERAAAEAAADGSAAGGAAAAATKAGADRGAGKPAPLSKTEYRSSIAERLVGAMSDSNDLQFSLIYRTPRDKRGAGAGGGLFGASSVAASNGGGGASNGSSSTNTLLSAMPPDNVRDLASFLERVESSWKDSREQCLRHEQTIERLRRALSEGQTVRSRLLRLCTEAGLLDESEIAVLAARSMEGGDPSGSSGKLDEDETEMDDGTFHARLAERHAGLADAFEAKQRRARVRQDLREQAAARPYDVADRQLRATRIAAQLAAVLPVDAAVKTAPSRKPLGPETEREARNREFYERRTAAVRSELVQLAERQARDQAELLKKHSDETAAVYRRIILEDADAKATLGTLFDRARTLSPRRHAAVRELLDRLGAPEQTHDSVKGPVQV